MLILRRPVRKSATSSAAMTANGLPLPETIAASTLQVSLCPRRGHLLNLPPAASQMSVVSGTTAIRIPTKTKVECMAWVPIRSKSVLCYSLEDHISGAAGQAGDWFWVEM